MGKALILDNLGLGRYHIRILHDRQKADKDLDRIKRWIELNLERTSALPIGDPEHKLPGLKLALASLMKQKEYLEKIPPDPETIAWCADYSTDLTGEIGTIEIEGEENIVLIQPGYRGTAAYNSERDGQSTHIMAMTPEQAFYNLAMTPGWKKWMPTYRIGTITEIDKCLCNIDLDIAVTEIVNFEGTRTINKLDRLSGVPIRYMDCDGTQFYAGDRVVVRFGNQDNAFPEVIGFESYPRGIDTNIVVFSAYRVGDADTGTWFVGAYDTAGNRIISYDINSMVGVPATMPLMVIGGHEDTNSVWISGSEYRDWGDGQGEVIHQALFRMPINWVYDGLLLKQAAAAPALPVTTLGITTGGYLLFSYGGFSDGDIWGGPGTYLVGFGTYYPHNKVELNVIPSIWTDINEDGERNEGETYPVDYKQYYNSTRGIGFLGNRCFMVHTYGYDPVPDSGTPPNEYYSPENYANHVDSIFGNWQYPRYATPPVYPDSDLTPYFTSSDPNFMETFYKDRFADWGYWAHDVAYFTARSTWQIIGCEPLNRLYVITSGFVQIFSGSQGYIRTVTEWNVTGKSNYDWGQFVRYGDQYLFACRFKNNTSSDNNSSSAIYFFEIEFFSLFATISITDNDPLRAGKISVVNIPTINMMLDQYNQLRNINDLYPVAFSRELSKVCQAHVDWCIAQGRQQHIGAGGKYPIERGIDAGFNSADEVLAGMKGKNRMFEEIAACMTGWRNSPGHWASINKPEQVIMGYAVGTYPQSLKKIIHGPGSFNPETGSYTTEEFTQELAPDEIGKTRLYCMMVCMD